LSPTGTQEHNRKLAYYAIHQGRNGFTGIVDKWWGPRGAYWYTNGVSGVNHKKFTTRAAAQRYIDLCASTQQAKAAAAAAAARPPTGLHIRGKHCVAAAAAAAAAAKPTRPVKAAATAKLEQGQEVQGGVVPGSDICRALHTALATVVRSRVNGGGAQENCGWTFGEITAIFGITPEGQPELWREVIEAFFGDTKQ